MAYLARSLNLLTLLRDRLDDRAEKPPDPLIESVVVNYLLTTIYADIEMAIHSILTRYGRGTGGHVRMHTFVEAAVKRVVRSLRCSELSGTLAMFDSNCKKHFQESVNDTPDQVAYDRIVAGRHDQSHSLGSDLTLNEVADDIYHCEVVLVRFAEALRCSCEH